MDVRIAEFHNIVGLEGTWKGGHEKALEALCRKVAESYNGGSIQNLGQRRSNPFISLYRFAVAPIVNGFDPLFRGKLKSKNKHCSLRKKHNECHRCSHERCPPAYLSAYTLNAKAQQVIAFHDPIPFTTVASRSEGIAFLPGSITTFTVNKNGFYRVTFGLAVSTISYSGDEAGFKQSNNSFALMESGNPVPGAVLCLGPVDYADFNNDPEGFGGTGSVILSNITIDVELSVGNEYSVVWNFTSIPNADAGNTLAALFVGSSSADLDSDPNAVCAFLEVHQIH